MSSEITNCGLVSLNNITEIRDVSMRTLIFMSEDNGTPIYPYKVPLNKIDKILLPAILHSDNHFTYVKKRAEIRKINNLTGYILSIYPKQKYEKVLPDDLELIKGATAAIIGLGLTAVSTGYGIFKDIKANKASKATQTKLEPYKTPQEVIDVLNATKNNAQTGLGATTLDYLTNQTNQDFAGSLGIAQRLGADPNFMSAIFGKKVDAINGIATADHGEQLKNFAAYLAALNSSGANSAAGQKSQQDLLKDQLQKIAQDKAVAAGQISQGINTGISTLSSYEMGKLLGDDPFTKKFTNAYGNQGASAAAYAKDNNLSFNQYKEQLKKNITLIGSF